MLDRARAAPAARGAAVTPESKSGVLTCYSYPAKLCPQTSGTATVAQTCKELIRGGLLPEKDVLAETDYGGKWGVIVNVSCDYQEENKTQLPRQLHEEIEQATTASPMLTHLNQQQETQICHILKEVATLFAASPRRTMLGKQIISLKDGHLHPYQFIQHLVVQSAGMIFMKDGSLHRLLGDSTPRNLSSEINAYPMPRSVPQMICWKRLEQPMVLENAPGKVILTIYIYPSKTFPGFTVMPFMVHLPPFSD